MDNASLISTFVESVITHKSVLLANSELRIEPAGKNLQLWAKKEGLLSSAPLFSATPWFTLKGSSGYSTSIHEALTAQHYLPTKAATANGFEQYESATLPQGYKLHCEDGLLFLQAWWQYQTQDQQASILGMLLWHNRTWHPIRLIECDRGVLKVFTWGSQILLQPEHRTVWLLKESSPVLRDRVVGEAINHGSDPEASEQGKTASEATSPAATKCIGNYLVEAGLLSAAQVDIILSDQAATGMRFGEIVASRGWLKTQTIEYLMTHMISPQQQPSSTPATPRPQASPQPTPRRRVEDPIASIHDRETLVVSIPFDEDPISRLSQPQASHP